MIRIVIAAWAALGLVSVAAAAEIELSVERATSLPEQVLLEHDLRQAGVQVLPVLLSRQRQRYRLIVDDTRIEELGYWLQGRGFRVQRTTNGWRAF